VWGGNGPSEALDTGGRYNPVTDAWTPTSTAGAVPTARTEHAAVWTGSEMIVWSGCTGGLGCLTFLTTGGRYDPGSDTWTPTSTADTPQGRHLHTAVWTGSEMFVWGGEGDVVNIFNDGGRYDPAADSWTPMSTLDAPEARVLHTAVWTGSDMVVFGGCRGSSCPNPQIELGGGARYHADTDTWTATNPVGAPGARYAHTAVWTGSEMIVQSGCVDNECSFQTASGGRYEPVSDSWTATQTAGAPSRGGHTAVWIGTKMMSAL